METSYKDGHWLELVYSVWVLYYDVEPSCYYAINLGQLC